MSTKSQSPLVRFFRSLFGFPEGQPVSCTCSGGSAGEVHSPHGGYYKVERKCYEEAAVPTDVSESECGCL